MSKQTCRLVGQHLPELSRAQAQTRGENEQNMEEMHHFDFQEKSYAGKSNKRAVT